MGPHNAFSWPENFDFERVGISNETKKEFVENEFYPCETLDSIITR